MMFKTCPLKAMNGDVYCNKDGCAWWTDDQCAIVALVNKKSANDGAEQKTNYEQYTISGRR